MAKKLFLYLGRIVLLGGIILSMTQYKAYSFQGDLGGNTDTRVSNQPIPRMAPPPIKISGIINDNNNNPIQDATVQLYYMRENSGKIYRYGTVLKQTNSTGSFSFSESEFLTYITPKIGSPQKPYAFFISVIKEGYLDTYIFDNAENPKLMSSGFWNVTGILKTKPQKLNKTQGIFSVSYYPGQDQCAQIALDKMAYYYPKIADVFGFQPDPSILKLTFNTQLEQGSSDWLGGENGISTMCNPWTDNIGSPQISAMWNESLPHEFGHVFVSSFDRLMPHWTNEGIAQHASKKANNMISVCDPATFLPVQDLIGENIPYYETAACFWKLLEDAHPGFIKNTMSYLQQLEAQNAILTYKFETYTKDFISGVLVKVLVNNYGMTNSDAQTYLDNFMVQFQYNANNP